MTFANQKEKERTESPTKYGRKNRNTSRVHQKERRLNKSRDIIPVPNATHSRKRSKKRGAKQECRTKNLVSVTPTRGTPDEMGDCTWRGSLAKIGESGKAPNDLRAE